jgi:hypothetical protein
MASVHELSGETTPDLQERYAERIRAEQSARSPGGESEVRRQLLREPFLLLDPMVEERAASTHFDKKSGLGCLAAVAAFVLAVVGLALESWTILLVCGGLLGLAIVMALFWLATDVRRFARIHVLPVLARGLRPFNPSPQELEDVIQEVRAAGLAIGRKVHPAHLAAALQGPAPPEMDQRPLVPR